MRRERERIITKARAKRQRKTAKRKSKPPEAPRSVDLAAQVQEVASAVSEKVDKFVDSATEAVKTVVTKKRFPAKKKSALH